MDQNMQYLLWLACDTSSTQQIQWQHATFTQKVPTFTLFVTLSDLNRNKVLQFWLWFMNFYLYRYTNQMNLFLEKCDYSFAGLLSTMWISFPGIHLYLSPDYRIFLHISWKIFCSFFAHKVAGRLISQRRYTLHDWTYETGSNWNTLLAQQNTRSKVTNDNLLYTQHFDFHFPTPFYNKILVELHNFPRPA